MKWNYLRRTLLTIASSAGLLWTVIIGGSESACASEAALKVGDKAPDFAIPGPEGREAAHLSDYQGKKNVLIAFYPKAFTPGCTKEMCGYRDDFSKLESQDVAVVAISVDEQEKSERFKEEYKLPFAVVGDPKAEIVSAYGVKRILGSFANREVFLVDKEGVIRYMDKTYDVVKGIDPLYKAIAELDSAKKPDKPDSSPEEKEPSSSGE